MANRDMTNQNLPGPEDLFPVRSRISWGAIFAGGAIALAVYFVMALLGAAVGFSVRNNVTYETMSTAAGLWAIFGAIVALFVGGFVTTQVAVGENRMEAVVHGAITWGVVFAALLWLAASGVSSGYSALVGAATFQDAMGNPTAANNWEETARRAGLTEEEIGTIRARVNNATDRPADPANREEAARTATAASWWALFGTILTMAAAIGGALLGSGPTFRLIGVTNASRIVLSEREPVLK
jgi:hypothetical protein